MLFWILSCAVISGHPGAADPPPFAAAVLEHHIAYLASDALEGRDAGSKGCEEAERYIREALASAGLDLVEEQAFEFNSGARLGEGSRLAIGDRELPAESFRPLAFSAAAEGSWPAVFAGYGIEAKDLGHDDYAGLDAGGKLVVVLRGSPDGDNPHGQFSSHVDSRAKALKAVEKGGKALLVLVTGKPGEEKLPEFHGEDITQDVGIPVIAVKESEAGKALGIDAAAAIAALNEHRRVSRPLELKVGAAARVSFEKRATRNVLGWLKARHPEARDEVVIAGAHHDHLGRGTSASMARQRLGEIHNGADDNASGVAGILELARCLKPRAAELKRSVLFITLGAEERGLLGSRYFKEHPVLRLPAGANGKETILKAVAMINLDMIGRLRENRLLASGLATSEAWPDLLEKVRKDSGCQLNLVCDRAEDLFGTSDHTNFYQMGLPVAFFFTGNHAQYHTPDDDLYRRLENGASERLINVEGMGEVLRYVAEVIAAAANTPQPLPYKPGVKLAPAAIFKVVLRLLPDYGADVAGMRIAEVTQDGPAAQAGLKAGDVIVRFGSTPVRSVRDYMVGLEKAKAGEEVEVEIVRGGKNQVLKVRPQGKAPANP